MPIDVRQRICSVFDLPLQNRQNAIRLNISKDRDIDMFHAFTVWLNKKPISFTINNIFHCYFFLVCSSDGGRGVGESVFLLLLLVLTIIAYYLFVRFLLLFLSLHCSSFVIFLIESAITVVFSCIYLNYHTAQHSTAHIICIYFSYNFCLFFHICNSWLRVIYVSLYLSVSLPPLPLAIYFVAFVHHLSTFECIFYSVWLLCFMYYSNLMEEDVIVY